jgi:hypothetical protein
MRKCPGKLVRGYRLRGTDAVHLATALGVNDALAGTGDPLVLIASDEELPATTQKVGLAILRHPAMRPGHSSRR